MRSTVLQESSSAQRRGEGSFGVAGHQSCISYRSPRTLDNQDISSPLPGLSPAISIKDPTCGNPPSVLAESRGYLVG